MPCQLTPNSHRLITCFLTSYEYYGLSALFTLFNHFYQVNLVGWLSSGYISISQRDGFKLIPNLETLIKKWNERIFFIIPVSFRFYFNPNWRSSYFKLQKLPLANLDTQEEVMVLREGGEFYTSQWTRLGHGQSQTSARGGGHHISFLLHLIRSLLPSSSHFYLYTLLFNFPPLFFLLQIAFFLCLLFR